MRTRLVHPTDFQILEALSDGRRDTAVNLVMIQDKNRDYINTRLPILADEGLIHRIGPADSSGLYQITPRGVVASQNQTLGAC
ncbi:MULTISPECIES: ArsR family transcriptional regulator [unclassified Halorubrum]|uniref:ArsR family transcriptional regulator n=1 Tax=unclassified Halorubrum TaxID=2642239 RepID=UPI0034E08526